MTAFDEVCMARALRLAEESIGLASPNPQVGCVISRNEEIVGEGAHLYDQFDHAEIVALKQAGDVCGGTAYVTLEPCSHHGRTGPCADALVAAGIARCFVATVDPNPLVSGQGIAKLRAAGVEVEVGLCEAHSRELNDAFALSIAQQRPFVTLKAALSVDGMLAPPPAARAANRPFWLTGPAAREQVQQLRHASDAILCGIGTVLADDPLLTDRTGLARRRPLMRVVVDSHLRTPLSAKLVQAVKEDVWIFCGHDAPADLRQALESVGIRVTAVDATASGPVGLDPVEILAHLHSAKLLSVLLEAGSSLNGAFLRQDLVDRAILFYTESELGPNALPFAEGTAGPFALEQKMISVRKQSFGPDVCVSGLLHDPWPKSYQIG